MEAWRLLFLAYSPKNNARLVVMMLEVLAFPLDTNDIVNSLETMERKIKEFEKYAELRIPEFLKVGIVIRQTEEGPLRTHLTTSGPGQTPWGKWPLAIRDWGCIDLFPTR